MSVKVTTKFKILAETPPWDWPADAGATLLAVLKDRRVAQISRLRAAGFAGNLLAMTDELAAELLGILQDPGEAAELRGRAAISLGPVLQEMDEAELDEDAETSVTEATFRRIQETLHRLALDTGIPTDIRRRVLEASVRATEDWHQDAVRSALASGDQAWELTGVFCLQYVSGLDEEIMKALGSKSPGIRIEAVRAAGAWGLKKAWPHLAALLTAKRTAKSLLLEAIDAAAFVNPEEAMILLEDLSGSSDEDIADAAFEALAMAEDGFPEFLDDEDDLDDDEDDPDEDNPDDEDRVS